MEQIIRGERIKQVRELIGYNQTELAQKLEVTQAAIALMESGRIMPTDNILNQLSFLTGFPVSFFKQEPIIDVPLGSLLFRGKRSVTVRERNQLYRYAQTLCELTNSLFRHIKPIPVKIPKLPNEEPSEAAKLTRSLLGLSPDKPIEHLTDTSKNS
jgi:transcriptional regulator with XRE-family HTH domain